MSNTQEQSVDPAAEEKRNEEEIRTAVANFWQRVPSDGGFVDPWEVIDTEPTDDKTVIKKTRQEFARRYHPDRLGPDFDPKLKADITEILAIVNQTCDELLNGDRPSIVSDFRISSRAHFLDGEVPNQTDGQGVSRGTRKGGSSGSHSSTQQKNEDRRKRERKWRAQQEAYRRQKEEADARRAYQEFDNVYRLSQLKSTKEIIEKLSWLKSSALDPIPLPDGRSITAQQLIQKILLYVQLCDISGDTELKDNALMGVPEAYQFRQTISEEQIKLKEDIIKFWIENSLPALLKLAGEFGISRSAVASLESMHEETQLLNFEVIRIKLHNIYLSITRGEYLEAQQLAEDLPNQFGLKLKVLRLIEQRREERQGIFSKIRKSFSGDKRTNADYDQPLQSLTVSELKPGQFLKLANEKSSVTLLVVASSKHHDGDGGRNRVEFSFFNGTEDMRRMSGTSVIQQLRIGETLKLNNGTQAGSLPEITNISFIQLSLSPVPAF